MYFKVDPLKIIFLKPEVHIARGKLMTGTHEATNKVEVLGHHLLEVVGDEDTAHIHLDGVDFLAVVVECVGRCCLRHKQD